MSPRRKTSMPSLLIRFWVWIMVLTALCAVCSIAMTRLHHGQHPWGLQLLWGADVGWDLTVFRERFVHFRQPNFWQTSSIPLTYPAFVGVIFGLIFRLPNPLALYLLVCACAVVAWAIWLVRALAARGAAPGPATVFVLTVTATSWPLWVLFDTANIEGLVAILTGIAIIAFIRQRPWVAASLIVLAGAMKIFPLILLALFLPQRRYREFLFGISLALAINIASLAVLGPSISEAQRNINAGLRIVTIADALAATSPGPDTNHSLYNAVRWATLVVNHRHPHATAPDPDGDADILRPVYLAYLALIPLAALVLYFVRIRYLPMLNQILALTLCAVTLPPLSRDYTLLNLLVPFGLVCILAASSKQQPPGLSACFACLAVIFTAGTYLNLGPSLASPIRALTLAVLFILALKYPFHSAYLDEPPHPANV